MTSRRFLWLLATIAMVAALAVACGDGDGSDSAAGVSTIEGGTLTVCSDPFPPFEFEDDDGTFTGFDIEVLRAIATNLGLGLKVEQTPFDGIWLQPASDTCDIVASALTITPERAEAALFSDPYFDADQSLLVRALEADDLATLADLTDKTIGVQSGTTGEEYANENSPEGSTVRAIDGGDALFSALESGEVDAVLQDFPLNLDRANKDGSFAVTDSFATGEQYGFATSEDKTALMDAVNTQLAAIRDDGTYDSIFEEFFPTS